jgi:large subunit ribosomal protein L17
MRHKVKGKKLNRTASHRNATLRSLSIALIKNERIVTTTTKAKELRRIIEPIITRAKEDTTHNRRQVFAFLHDNISTSKLFNEIAPKCVSRPGGYTRVIKLGTRQGDGAEIAVIELVDYNDVRPDETGAKKSKATRRSGSKAKAKATTAPAAAAPAVIAETPAETVEDVKVAEAEVVETVSETVVETVEDVVEVTDVAEVVEETAAEEVESVDSAEESPDAADESAESEEKKED